MTKGSRYTQQIIITQARTIQLGLSFRVIRGRVNRVSLYLGSFHSILSKIKKNQTSKTVFKCISELTWHSNEIVIIAVSS